MNLEQAVTHRLTRWAVFWERITQPAASLSTKDEQQQARLLATISLTFLLLGLIGAPPWIIIAPDRLWAVFLAGSMLTIFGLAYWLSRTYQYTRGAVLLSLSIFLLVIVNMWLSPSPIPQRMLMLMALVSAVMVSILFLRRRFTMMLIGICFAIITAHFFIPDLPFIYPFAYSFFFVVLMGLAIVTHTVGQYYKRELADSEARYRALFQQSHDAVFMLSLNGDHIEANQRAADMLGYTLAEINQLSVGDITAESDQSEKILERIVAGDHIPVYERRFRCKDGTFIPVEIKVELVCDAAGQPTHIQSVVRDITDRKQQEQQLRLQSAALQAAANAIVITDTNGKIEWANPAYSRLTQYTLEETLGKNPRELVKSGVHNEAFYKTMWDTILSGQVWQGTLINQRKDSSHYTEEQTITPLADAQGNITHFVAIKQDITEREASAQALRQSEARQRALLHAIPDLMFRYNRDGICLDYHASNPSNLIMSPEQFLERNVFDVLPETLAQSHMAYTEQVLRTNQPVIYEYDLVIKNERRYFESRMVLSGIDEVLTIVRDITQQKMWQKQAVELTLEKERAKVLRQFIRNSSHELRTPLTIINNNLYLLQKVDDPDRKQRYVRQSQAQIIRLTHLLDMVIAMTQLDSDVPFNFAETDINALIMQIVADWPNRECDHIKPVLDVDASLPLCCVDAVWLQRGIRHILDNAVRFTPDGGSIQVRTGMSEAQVVIEIKDDGLGISNGHLPRIFERFWRHDEAHSTPGFGLGLPIAQKIVENHNGRIEVESKVGQGSRFRILLPAHENSNC